jgi:hypothetical protein
MMWEMDTSEKDSGGSFNLHYLLLLFTFEELQVGGRLLRPTSIFSFTVAVCNRTASHYVHIKIGKIKDEAFR